MTILMTFAGAIVFVFSLVSVGFKSAFKRLWMFALTGLCIDVLIVALAVGTTYILNH